MIAINSPASSYVYVRMTTEIFTETFPSGLLVCGVTLPQWHFRAV